MCVYVWDGNLIRVLWLCSRRLHRLEREQAEIEYDIRMLMEQPESNKTDSDKAREDNLIARKIEVSIVGEVSHILTT